MNMLRTLFVLPILIGFSVNGYSDAFAESNKHIIQDKLPSAVIETIRVAEEDCRIDKSDTKQKMKTNPDNIVQRADINGDGITDYMFFDSNIYCEAGASFRQGNGGVGVVIFAGIKNGGAIEAFGKTVSGARIEKSGSKNVVWVAVGGGYCGQENLKSKADAISCDRPLVWDSKTEKFDFAPLSEARFPTQLFK